MTTTSLISSRPLYRSIFFLAASAGLVSAAAAVTPPPVDVDYPGTIRLSVDATDIAHRIMRVHEEIPVAPGPLTLLFPQWLPGEME